MECTVAESPKSHQFNVAPSEVCFKQSALQAGKAHDSVCGEVSFPLSPRSSRYAWVRLSPGLASLFVCRYERSWKAESPREVGATQRSLHLHAHVRTANCVLDENCWQKPGVDQIVFRRLSDDKQPFCAPLQVNTDERVRGIV
jgi:hypothetical protein